jgi:hypothetical protein
MKFSDSSRHQDKRPLVASNTLDKFVILSGIRIDEA